MAKAHESQTSTDEQNDSGVYLPAMPSPSATPGRIERFLTNLFGRRGGLRAVVRQRDR